MKRYIMIFLATIVVAKIMASGLAKVVPQTNTDHIFEKMSLKNLAHTLHTETPTDVLNNNKTPLPTVVGKFNYVPKSKTPTQNSIKVSTPVIQNLAVEKKAPLVTAKADESARRKKRKKKLEQANKDKEKKDSNEKAMATQNMNSDNSKPKAKYLDDSNTVNIGSTAAAPKAAKAVSTPVTASLPVAAKAKVNLATWSQSLVSNPTGANFKTFLNLYKTSQISSAEYYSVVSNLQKSQNLEARKLAVMGSSVEATLPAFEILVQEKYSESDAETVALAQARLQVYNKPAYLNILLQALHADEHSKVEASNMVTQIAATVAATPQSLTPEIKNSLSGFLAPLAPLASASASSPLQTSAQQALVAVRSVLGITS